MTMEQYPVNPGRRYPPGATFSARGTNFCIFSRQATTMELLLYRGPESLQPFQVITLDPHENRTFFFWHVFVEGLPAGTCYTWRADGPDDTRLSGNRFNREKELLDPWAKTVVDNLWDRRRTCRPGPSNGHSMRAMVVKVDDYDWEGDTPLHHSPEKTIIYELHVAGFTRHQSSGVSHPGTYSGLIEKIPYLKELGITAVELLPVMAFDEQDLPESSRRLGLKNFWGYSTHSFYSPHPHYCTNPLADNHIREFRDMVKALHKADIAVILDVVFNHTAEGNEDGPLINFKGLANSGFYHLEPHDRRLYRDYTGCGNSVNCNHPLVARFIVYSLEYWVREMHIDAFRFDLASVLARGMDGRPDYYAPVIWSIEFSGILARTGLIAEAWDAGGLYQVGGFPGFRWAEWNGRYRDVVREFVRGDKGTAAEMATRYCGSSDLYESSGRLPSNSINFVTCHDGFTLWDLVSYNEKHNRANGENNRDGCNDNLSWNCGHEGETTDGSVLALRRRQARNFMAILLLSHGVPMLLCGDEVLRSQRGNNNCYCQDNELSWFDWTLVEKNREMFRFIREMIAFRKRHPCLMRRRFFTGSRQKSDRLPDITWHGRRLQQPAWNDPKANLLAFTLGGSGDEEDLHIIFNMTNRAQTFALPDVPGRTWHQAIDTGAPGPDDIRLPADQRRCEEKFCKVKARSVVVLESRG
ncbi:MAG: glycogen debranching protein GlgX [Deltaproteobacteria bacterium]|nr:glycogen debranching protein GlgX [Deltaproteobacteria bacterium]